jgi:hypothetical protein
LAGEGVAKFVSIPGRAGVWKTVGNDLAVLVDLVDVVIHVIVDPVQALFRNGFQCAWRSIFLGVRTCLILPNSQVLENLANYRRVFDKGDDFHRGTALWTNQWGCQIDFFDELSPRASTSFAIGSVKGILGGTME